MVADSDGLTTEISFAGSRPIKQQTQWAIYICLVVASLASFLPVLLCPHWGLFSDAGQIIQNGRVFWADPLGHLDLIRGYWRPGFHTPDLTLWFMFGENPFWFYLFRALLFTANICLTYSNTLLLSGSRTFSAIAALFWIITSSTFEVIYTLDKGEIYVVALINVALLCYLQQDLRLSTGAAARVINISALIGLIASTMYAVYTKETSQLLLVFAFLSLIGSVVIRSDASVPNASKQKADRIRWAAIFLSVVFVSIISYKIYMYTTGGAGVQPYVVMDFKTKHVLQRLDFLLHHLPDLLAMVVFCFTSSIIFARGYRFQSSAAMHATNMMLTGIAGMAVLLGFPGALTYIWFPLFVFLLPCTALYLSYWIPILRTRLKFAKQLVIFIGVIYVLALMPMRLQQAALQFQIDALIQDLTSKLADIGRIRRGKQLQLIFPFTEPRLAEIGERIEFLTFDKIYSGYVQKDADFNKEAPFDFCNMLDYDSVLKSDDFYTFHRAGANKRDLIYESRSSRDHLGLSVLCYADDIKPPHRCHWIEQDLENSSWFLIPFGDVPNDLSGYRGAGLFQSDWQSKVAFIPQLQLTPLFQVSRRIAGLGSRKSFHIGWLVAQMKKPTFPLEWTIEPDGWLMSPSKISYASSLEGHRLIIGTRCAHPSMIKVTNLSDSRSFDVKPIFNKDMYFFEIPFPKHVVVHTPEEIQISAIDLPNCAPDPRKLMLHVDQADLK